MNKDCEIQSLVSRSLSLVWKLIHTKHLEYNNRNCLNDHNYIHSLCIFIIYVLHTPIRYILQTSGNRIIEIGEKR